MKYTKLKFSTNQTVDGVIENIMKVLPEVETEWEIITKNDEPIFITTIGNVKFEVERLKITFTLSTGKEDVIKVYQKLKKIGQNTKPLEINLYKTLMTRFDCHDDYEFYHKVWRTIDIVNEKQHTRNEVSFTEGKNSCGGNCSCKK